MIEKLKAFGEAAKSTLLYIIAPILFVLGYIYYLTTKNKNLKAEIAHMQADESISKTQQELQEAQNASNDAEKNYESIRDAYLKQSSDSSGQS